MTFRTEAAASGFNRRARRCLRRGTLYPGFLGPGAVLAQGQGRASAPYAAAVKGHCHGSVWGLGAVSGVPLALCSWRYPESKQCGVHLYSPASPDWTAEHVPTPPCASNRKVRKTTVRPGPGAWTRRCLRATRGTSQAPGVTTLAVAENHIKTNSSGLQYQAECCYEQEDSSQS